MSLLLASHAGAAVTYHVSIDTSVIAGSSAGPFYLDLSLIDGGTTGNNTVTATNFSYTAGSSAGTAAATGGSTGDLGTIANFDNSNFFQDLYQMFSSGTTRIDFDVTSTTNVDPGLTPDLFSLSILDNSVSNISTTSGADNVLFTQPIDSSLASSLSGTTTFTGTGDYSGVTVAVTPVPEAGAPLLIAASSLAACALRRRK
jgi:hypothetical protein